MIGKIKGSYTVIGNINNRVVLAYSSTAVEPWVVWYVDTDGDFYSGSYFGNRQAAINEFCSRSWGCYNYAK